MEDGRQGLNQDRTGEVEEAGPGDWFLGGFGRQRMVLKRCRGGRE